MFILDSICLSSFFLEEDRSSGCNRYVKTFVRLAQGHHEPIYLSRIRLHVKEMDAVDMWLKYHPATSAFFNVNMIRKYRGAKDLKEKFEPKKTKQTLFMALACWPIARGHRTYTTNRFAMIGERELACQDLRNVEVSCRRLAKCRITKTCIGIFWRCFSLGVLIKICSVLSNHGRNHSLAPIGHPWNHTMDIPWANSRSWSLACLEQ